MDSNNTVLIVYATRNRQTEKIARRMGDALKAAGRPVMLVDAGRARRPIPVDGVGAVLVGAPILAGGYSRHVRRFVREHRDVLARVPSAFFSVGLAVASRTHDGRAQSLEVVEKFIKKTGWRPPRVELIAGALKYTEYGFITRFVIRRIAKAEGGDTDTSRDYEYTDWAAVDRFAREVGGAVPVGALTAEKESGLRMPA